MNQFDMRNLIKQIKEQKQEIEFLRYHLFGDSDDMGLYAYLEHDEVGLGANCDKSKCKKCNIIQYIKERLGNNEN